MRPAAVRTEKVYVKVNSDFDSTGYMHPRAIIWEDGRTFRIEQVRDFCPASFLSPGLQGDCYTVIINGEEKHLFFERVTPLSAGRFGRWYVEKTVPLYL